MNLKWIGAGFIICSCGLVGFKLSASARAEEQDLRQLINALDYMVCELNYKQSPLPELSYAVGNEHKGRIGKLFINLANELDAQLLPDVQACLAAAAATAGPLSRKAQQAICIMGSSLGRFDLEGQIQGLESVRAYCREQLKELSSNRDVRLRSYQTLGLCAGAALAILFV